MDTLNLTEFRMQLAMIDTAWWDLLERGDSGLTRTQMRGILESAAQYDKTERHQIPSDATLQHRAGLGGMQYLTDYDFRDMVTQYIVSQTRFIITIYGHVTLNSTP